MWIHEVGGERRTYSPATACNPTSPLRHLLLATAALSLTVALLTSASVVAQPTTFEATTLEATPSCNPQPPTFVPIAPIINFPVVHIYNSTCTRIFVSVSNGGRVLIEGPIDALRGTGFRSQPTNRYCFSLERGGPTESCQTGYSNSVTEAHIMIYAPLPDRSRMDLLINSLARWLFNGLSLDAKSAPRHRTPRRGTVFGVRG